MGDDGMLTITIAAHVEDRIRVDQWARSLQAAIRQFEGKYSAEIEVETVCAQDKYIAARLGSLLQSLMLGATSCRYRRFRVDGLEEHDRCWCFVTIVRHDGRCRFACVADSIAPNVDHWTLLWHSAY